MSKKRKKHGEEHNNSERWLLSYADFITLLMIFFVIMYAMSQSDEAQYEELTRVLSVEMGNGGQEGINLLDEKGKTYKLTDEEIAELSDDELTQLPEEEKQKVLKNRIDEYVKENDLSDAVSTSVEERGLVLSFKDSLLFDSGQSTVKDIEMGQFITIGKMLNHPMLKDSYIRVEGHTDDVPINSSSYQSNWDLSVLRASNVTQILIEKSGIAPDRVSVIGYGEYRPLTENRTEEGRKINRRVDILIMSSELNDSEDNSR